MPIIETRDVYFRYQNGEGLSNEVLQNINISINKGELVAILGHNGSGKSTLAKLFNAILLPSEGKVFINGIDTSDEERLYDIRQNVGMVFQNPDNQIVATIVEEDVAFAPENLGVPAEEIRLRVDYALQTVGMYEYIKHAPHMLSGGQKQRVAIAGVLAMKPQVLVLDESTAMLDPSGRREIMKTIKRLNRDEDMTVILITHYMNEAAQCDRVIVLNEGKAIMDGKPSSIFAQVDTLKAIGLDVPQTTELIYELNKEGYSFNQSILTIEECVRCLQERVPGSGIL